MDGFEIGVAGKLLGVTCENSEDGGAPWVWNYRMAFRALQAHLGVLKLLKVGLLLRV